MLAPRVTVLTVPVIAGSSPQQTGAIIYDTVTGHERRRKGGGNGPAEADVTPGYGARTRGFMIAKTLLRFLI